jgi:hypothetical protein
MDVMRSPARQFAEAMFATLSQMNAAMFAGSFTTAGD